MSTEKEKASARLRQSFLKNPAAFQRLMQLEALRRGLDFEGKEDVIASIKARAFAKKLAREAISKAKSPGKSSS